VWIEGGGDNRGGGAEDRGVGVRIEKGKAKIMKQSDDRKGMCG